MWGNAGGSWKHGRIVELPKTSLGLVPRSLWAGVWCRAGCWVIPLPSQGERCSFELRFGVWRCPPGHPAVTPRRQEPPAGQDKGMEGDPLPLRWQLRPRTQGCSARTSPGICRHPPHPQGSPVMASCVPTHSGDKEAEHKGAALPHTMERQ